jgi:hypothetical protein
VARMRRMRNVYRNLFGKSEGKRSLGRRRRRWTGSWGSMIEGDGLD